MKAYRKIDPPTAERLREIRRAMSAALRAKPQDIEAYHRLGAEHRKALHAASPVIAAMWNACLSDEMARQGE